MTSQDELTYFASRKLGHIEHRIGIAQPDRRYHTYCLGRTGTGKSTLLANMIINDLQAGRGLALIDPHGDLAEQVLPFVPPGRSKHLVYFNPADIDFPIGFNVLGRVEVTRRHLVADNLMSVFRKTWPESWGPRMDYYWHHAVLALLEFPDSTLLSLVRFVRSPNFREKIIGGVQDPSVRQVWLDEFESEPKARQSEILSPIRNKVGAYASNLLLRNLFGQSKNKLRLPDLMNNGGILIVNLAKGKVGSTGAKLLGALFVTQILQIAMARADIPEAERRDFNLYVDEFHNFTNESFAEILAEARKYRLILTVANQFIKQIRDEHTRNALLANVGTLIAFRVGLDDVNLIGEEFRTETGTGNLIELSPHEIRYKLMRNGSVTDPASATTLPPLPPPDDIDIEAYKAELINACRRRYAMPRERVERRIAKFFERRPAVTKTRPRRN